jgi:serine protease AprX
MIRRAGGLGAAVLLLALALFAAVPSSVLAEDPGAGRGKIDEHVRRAAAGAPHATVPVIVHRASGSAAAGAVERHGGKVRQRLKTKNAVAADVPANKIEALAREPGVTRISFDAPVRRQSLGPDPARLLTVYQAAVQATELWNDSPPVLGTGVTVAVLDSGIKSGDDFKGVDEPRAKPGQDRILQHVRIADTLEDDNGHGTFVAGIVGGRGWGGSGEADDGRYVGIAPDVNLIDVNVSDKSGAARTSQVIQGIEWVVQNRDVYGIRVLNVSLLSSTAESYKTSLLDAAIEIAWRKGIAVVVAAGNGGPDTMLFPPANDPFAIVVGATDDMGSATTEDDRLVWFSAYGRTQDGFAKPDLVAPGRRIVSVLSDEQAPLALQFPGRIVDRRYIRLSGTSAAAPVVSGVVAQLLQGRSGLGPDQVKWLLLSTALAVPGVGTGAGYPQAATALRYSDPIGRANQGIAPNEYVARAGCAATPAACASVDWNSVSWDSVSWDSVSWDSVSWDSVSWDSVSWDSVSWDSVSWDSVAGD